jgi:POTRA domain, FtsQ-type
LSLLKRKSKNRRHGRDQHVLDVKLRSDQVRANRMRFGAIGLVSLAGTLTAFFVLWHVSVWALDLLAYKNPAFDIERIDVQTDGVVSKEQVRRWAGVKVGENLLALDLARIKRDLEMAPAIRSAAVERVMPHLLKLRVTERVPVAQVMVLRIKPDGSAEPGIVLLDKDGVVMLPLTPGQRAQPAATNAMLPALCGVSLSKVLPGKKIDLEQVHAALDLICAFNHSPMTGLAQLRQIDVSAPEILQATTETQSKIVFALTGPGQQLRRWRDIRDRAQRQGSVIATLDLSVPGNIPVVLTAALPLQPSPAPSHNPQPTPRKKNV